jgi:hypothetical protein
MKKHNPLTDTTSKTARYFVAKKQGYNKEEAKLLAGYSKNTKAMTIERTEVYKALSVKDTLLTQITLNQIANEHAKVIEQDEQQGAKIAAIKLAYDTIEPNNLIQDADDKVLVVLAGRKVEHSN